METGIKLTKKVSHSLKKNKIKETHFGNNISRGLIIFYKFGFYGGPDQPERAL